MNIPDANNINRHIVSSHGLLSYQYIEDIANVSIVNQLIRATQDNMMLYHCLYNYVNKTVKKNIILKTENYKMGGISIAADFYKILISTTEVEAKATLTFIQIKLTNLKDKFRCLTTTLKSFALPLTRNVSHYQSRGKSS